MTQQRSVSDSVPAVQRRDAYQWSGGFSQELLGKKNETPPVAVTDAARPSAVSLGRPRRRRWVRRSLLTVLSIAAVMVAWFTAGVPARSAAPVPPTGRLTIETRPVGAAISIDGLPKGIAPLTLALPAGTHRVEVREATETREIAVTLAAGEHLSQYVEVQPAVQTPQTGRLQIESDPPGARVQVDGQARGASPLLLDQMAPGSHTVSVRGDSESVDRRVMVDAGATAFVFVPLVSKGAWSGWVAVSSPIALQLFEEGQLIGTTATERIMMPAGRHEIQFTNSTFGYEATRTISVTPGKTQTVVVELPQGTLHVNASPWADVWIDGKRIGETPLGNLRVPIGPHEVVFRHPQLGEQRHAVSVTVSQPTRLSVNLGK